MRAFAAMALAAAWLVAGPAAGHAMPNSTVVLEVTPAGIEASVSIPLSELEAARGTPVDTGGGRATLEAYLRTHVAVLAPDGRPWSLSFRDLTSEGGEHPALAARLTFTPPTGGSREASLRYDAVNHRIASHYALVYLRKGDALRPLGRLQYPFDVLPIWTAGP